MAAPVDVADLDLIFAHTRELWQEMRGQSIFITGGTGFFGCWLLESFAHINRAEALGAHATVLTRDAAAFREKCPHLASDPAITLHSGDIRDFAFPAGEFRYVIHAATESSAKKAAENPMGLLAAIAQGTERTLDFAASHGTQKFLLTSSGAVYGAQPPSLPHLPENYAGGPNCLDAAAAYAEGKRVAELMCTLYGSKFGLECKIARCFAFVGPHLPLDAHFAIGNFIRDAMRGHVIEVNGDGTPKRSYLYAADLAIWLWTLLFRAPAMSAFNVGSEEAISIADLAHTVADALGSGAGVSVAQKAIAGAALRQYVPSTCKAERELGLKRTVSLEEAICRTAAWYGHPAGRN